MSNDSLKQEIISALNEKQATLTEIRLNGGRKLLSMHVAATDDGEILTVDPGAEIGKAVYRLSPIATKGRQPLTGPCGFVGDRAKKWNRNDEVIDAELYVTVVTYAQALDIAIDHVRQLKVNLGV